MTEITRPVPASRTSPRWHTVVAALCVILAAVAVFLPTFQFSFVSFDDGNNVYENPYLNPVTAQTLPRFWGESYNQLYTPVTYSLWTGVAALPGAHRPKPDIVPPQGEASLRAAWFHALGVLCHVLASVLLFCLLHHLPILRERSPVFAALGAVLWAVHPLQAESVSWVTGNNNVFSGLFMLAALAAFVYRFDAKTDRATLCWYLLATVLYIMALLAKPTAAALPLVAFALAVGAYRQSPRSLLFPIGVWLCLAAGLLLLTRNTSEPVTDVSLPIWQRPFVVGDALAFYAAKIFLPIRLGIDYGRRPEWLRTQAWFYVTWLVPVILGAGLIAWHRRTRSVVAATALSGYAVFVAGALPMLGVAPYYFHRISTVADRYVYLALIGVAIIAVSILAQLPKKQVPLAVVGFGVIIIALGAQCRQQAYAWRNSVALFENTVRVNSRSMLGHSNLAGCYASLGRTEAALRELEIAEDCPPSGRELQALIQAQLGDIYAEHGETARAINAYEKGIRFNRKLTAIPAQLAVLYWRTGDEPNAKRVVSESLQTASSDPVDVAYSMGSILLQSEVPDLGLPLLLQIAQTNGEHAADACYFLAVWYVNHNRQAQAIPLLQRALLLKPGWQLPSDLLKQLGGGKQDRSRLGENAAPSEF